MKRFISILLALVFLLCCVSSALAEDEEENYETGDAALDDPLNADEIGEKELLVVSFGTSYNDSRRMTVGGIERALQHAFPDWSVRRAFTSQIIIDHVKSRDGEVIDNVSEALDRAVENGVKTLVVQPTHLMHGFEYTDLVNELAEYADAFESITVGEPLVNSEEDFALTAAVLADVTASYNDGKTAIVYMGHGTDHEANRGYARLQEKLFAAGHRNIFIGTVEATPTVEDVLTLVRQGGFHRVVLLPLMIVAGDHATNDMAGDGKDSWKNIFQRAGFDTVCVLRGLGERPAIRWMIMGHCAETMKA